MKTTAMKNYTETAIAAYKKRLHERAEAENHGQRWINNRLNKKKAELALISDAPSISKINISVEWKRSRTWGSNPTATVEIYTENCGFLRAIGKASGCGYDKESAAIAEALNQSTAIQKALIDATEGGTKTHKNGGFPYGARVSEWGATFSGAVGVESFRSVFEAMGFTWERVASGKMFDAYAIRKA